MARTRAVVRRRALPISTPRSSRISRRRKEPEPKARRKKRGRLQEAADLEPLKRIQPRIVSPACSSTEQKRSSMMSCPGGVDLLLAAATASGDLSAEALSGDLNPEASGSVGGSAGKRTSDRHVWTKEEHNYLMTFFDTPAKIALLFCNSDNYCQVIANKLNERYRQRQGCCDLNFRKVYTKAKELLKSVGLWQKPSGSVAQSEAPAKAAAGNRKGSSNSRSVQHTGAVASASEVSVVLKSVSSVEGVTDDMLAMYSEVLTYRPHYLPVAMLKGSSEETKVYLDSLCSSLS